MEYPEEVILTIKHDLNAAYLLMHQNPDQAVLSITIIDGVDYLEVQLPFRVAAGSSKYITMSEMLFDLTNDLLADKTWNHKTILSPLSGTFDVPAISSPSPPYGIAKLLHSHITLRETFCGGYIDDAITVVLHRLGNSLRAQNAVPLAIHALFPSN